MASSLISQLVSLRTWTRRDRRLIAHWPSPFTALPAHWLEPTPSTAGQRVSYAVDRAGQLVGRLSLRELQGGCARVGIYLHPAQCGRGYGSAALRLLCELPHLVQLRADVAADNVRSLKAFTQAGFVAVGDTWRGGYRYLELERHL